MDTSQCGAHSRRQHPCLKKQATYVPAQARFYSSISSPGCSPKSGPQEVWGVQFPL